MTIAKFLMSMFIFILWRDIEPGLKKMDTSRYDWSELIAAMKSFNEAAKGYSVSVAQVINEINEETVYESKRRRDNEI